MFFRDEDYSFSGAEVETVFVVIAINNKNFFLPGCFWFFFVIVDIPGTGRKALKI